ncbi:MAG: mannitol-specific PTS transporter subunit IIC [Deltaproteobacteria bacterium]|jgi:PTS system mannitol-specific IIC component|nr:mannitol-specific PTS transporter subunit IIC [Deltaproteobacteria bacterium]
MKESVQRAGRFLSSMVMPNIGAFIAWGLITALFIPDGWLPNVTFAALVGPMIKYLIPLLIAYTGGYVVHKQRGAVVGAIAGFGVIVGAEMPMFLGVMLMGPVGGLVIRQFDALMERRIPAGFEMLVNNFSAGILGGILAILGLVAINPACVAITNALSSGVNFFVTHRLLPLAALFVEPAKVLFLNNAINHGIFTPLGIAQAEEAGKSIFFMIESNPGPGLGLLVAYMLAGKGIAKSSAPGAIIIHFFGGIHEIYFPYVLMNPVVILGTIAGNATGILTLIVLNGGLVAAASPGSIFAEMLMTPHGGFTANILAISLSAAVSFVISFLLLKFFGKDADLDAARNRVTDMKAVSKGLAAAGTGAAPSAPHAYGKTGEAEEAGEAYVSAAGQEKPGDADMGAVRKIIFACDAGMGSSAMGATMLRKKLKGAGIEDIEVKHSPVSEIPKDAQVIVTHHELKARAAASCPSAKLVLITNFMGAPEYDALVSELSGARKKG